MRYSSPTIQFPQFVEDGATVLTPAGPGKVLVSLGRRSARGGVKHLGVLDQAEALAVFVALDKEFGLTELVATIKAAKAAKKAKSKVS